MRRIGWLLRHTAIGMNNSRLNTHSTIFHSFVHPWLIRMIFPTGALCYIKAQLQASFAPYVKICALIYGIGAESPKANIERQCPSLRCVPAAAVCCLLLLLPPSPPVLSALVINQAAPKLIIQLSHQLIGWTLAFEGIGPHTPKVNGPAQRM